MNTRPIESTHDERRELQNRIRIGVTGLAFVFVLVLLVASFSGTASNEPTLTSDARVEGGGSIETAVTGEGGAPQEPLAELGVAPSTMPEEGNSAAEGEVVAESLEELDSGRRP